MSRQPWGGGGVESQGGGFGGDFSSCTTMRFTFFVFGLP